MFKPLVDPDVHLGREASHVGLILEHIPDLTVQAVGRAIQDREVSSFPSGSLPAGQVVTHHPTPSHGRLHHELPNTT